MEYLKDTLFIGGLPGGTTEATLVAFFHKYGSVSGATVMRDHLTRRPRGFGFVSFSCPSSADRALADSPNISIFEMKVNVRRANVGMSQWPQQQSTSSNSWYINGMIIVDGVGSKLRWNNLTRWDLVIYFRMFGWLKFVDVPTDKFGCCWGFAYITFAFDYAAESVMRRRFHLINGKVVQVMRAVQWGMVGSENRSETNRGDDRPGGSSRPSDYIDSPAPTNIGVLQPALGSFTSGTDDNGDQILQRGEVWNPSGNTQNFPRVSMVPSGNSRYVSPTNLTRDPRQVGVIGSRTMHNRETARAMNQRGFVSENALADENSSRDEYETLEFDGTA